MTSTPAPSPSSARSSARRATACLAAGAAAVTALVGSGGTPAAGAPLTAATPSARAAVPPATRLEFLGRYSGDAAEIAAYAPFTRRLYVTDAAGASLQIVDASDIRDLTDATVVDLSAYGTEVTSVAVSPRRVAVAVKNGNAARGTLVLLDPRTDAVTDALTVGYGPDAVTFTPDGRTVLVANEGEPEGYLPGQIDGEGSVSVVDVRPRPGTLGVRNVVDAGFGSFSAADLDESVRISGPGATVAQDLEPEYIAVDANSTQAFVTLQENNAVATLDLRSRKIVDIAGLGYADHSQPGHGIDASDRDGGINIAQQPGVLGMYMPDAIATFRSSGRTYYATANEGDTRDWDGWADDARASTLLPAGDPRAAASAQGRLTVTPAAPYVAGGPLYAFGSRSFSIRAADGSLVWDSGDAFEQITADRVPALFNSDESDPEEFDARSDNKGPEPEGIAVGSTNGRTYAFIGLERTGGIMLYDVTTPTAPVFLDYVLPGVDVAPEGLQFVPPYLSPTGRALLVVSNEVSATTSVYQVRLPR